MTQRFLDLRMQLDDLGVVDAEEFEAHKRAAELAASEAARKNQEDHAQLADALADLKTEIGRHDEQLAISEEARKAGHSRIEAGLSAAKAAISGLDVRTSEVEKTLGDHELSYRPRR